ncbi:MAG: ROK family protein, partial [Phaeodactylibacter sp.]|nr:ROK family protein [Phaeodactylibacter sp.]
MKRYLGIDIGGTNIKVVGMEASGQILFKEEQSTEDG